MIDLNLNPSRKDLRWFAVLQLAFFSLIAALAYRKGASATTMVAIIAASALVGVAGLIWTPLLRWIYVGWMIAVYPIGWVVSYVILSVIYFGVFTPLGILVHLVSGDSMHCKFDKAAKTYWIRRAPDQTVQRYFRQF